MIKLVELARIIRANKDGITVNEALDEASEWFKNIYNPDTGRTNVDKLNQFLIEIDKLNVYGELKNEIGKDYRNR